MDKLTQLFIALATSLILLLGAGPQPTFANDDSRNPESVVKDFIAAENAHNIDKLFALSADALDFRSFNPDGTLAFDQVRLRLEQRGYFEQAVHLNPQSHFRIVSMIVSGPVVVTEEEVTGLKQRRERGRHDRLSRTERPHLSGSGS